MEATKVVKQGTATVTEDVAVGGGGDTGPFSVAINR